jgi:hypothetical protein
MRHAFTTGIALAALGLGAGCLDPCRQLAERICSCELTEAQREACREERIEQQSDDPLGRGVETTTEEQEACSAALETCTCDAIDAHEANKCGFVRDGEAGS